MIMAHSSNVAWYSRLGNPKDNLKTFLNMSPDTDDQNLKKSIPLAWGQAPKQKNYNSYYDVLILKWTLCF